MPDRAVIKTSATSANLGPGFDCLGLAFALHNETTVTRSDSLVSQHVAEPPHPMVEEAASLFFSHPRYHGKAFSFAWQVKVGVPVSRGLGSSVALRLGIFEGLNALAGGPLRREDLFSLCNAAEGHPDNAGPGVWGGFFLASAGGTTFQCPVSEDLHAVVLIPDQEVNTEAARSVLPESVPRRLAVRNTANASCLAAAFITGKYELMRGCFDDFLHQPYRRHLVPGLMEVIAAGESAGALGGYLSGSGSSIACLCLASEINTEDIRGAMQQMYANFGAPCRAEVLQPDNSGVRVIQVD